MRILHLFFQRHRGTPTLLFLILTVIIITTLTVQAAYRVQRPITTNGGIINQTHLWVEFFNNYNHRGLDFLHGLNTNVYAITNGTVVDLRENVPNNTGTSFGNFILIRHTTRHYDRTTGQWAYVYSLYAHLSQSSVIPGVGNQVTTGQQIAQVDRTGNVTGDHLHLQAMVHPQMDRILSTLNSEDISRNPELWLAPFNYLGTQTATAVGKITDTNGNPVAGLRIYGLDKPAIAEGNNPGNIYQWSETYPNLNWANPDDILVENFATTDVAPGTYHLYARYTNGTLYEDLGNQTFLAGQTTYVGLYSAFLPEVRSSSSSTDWQSVLYLRNDHGADRAQINTTFFQGSSTVNSQQTNFLNAQSRLTIDPSGSFFGTAGAVPSERLSTVAATFRSSDGNAYASPAIAATDPTNPGWGRAGVTIRLPLLTDNNAGWSTSVTVFNITNATATVSAVCYGQGTDWSTTTIMTH